MINRIYNNNLFLKGIDCLLTGHSSICSTFTLSNIRPGGTVGLQSHHTWNCVGGCYSIRSTYETTQQSTCIQQSWCEVKEMDLMTSATFMSSLGNINDIGHIWCQFGKERNGNGCTHPATNVTHQYWVLWQRHINTYLFQAIKWCYHWGEKKFAFNDSILEDEKQLT